VKKKALSSESMAPTPQIRYEALEDWKARDSVEFDKEGNIHVKLSRRFPKVPKLQAEGARKLVEDAIFAFEEVDGEYWRGTNNADEIKILDQVTSRDHSSGRSEGGLSVSPGFGGSAFHGFKYYYKVKGDEVGTGADGEPVLKTPVAITPLMDAADAWEYNEKHTKYPPGWDREKVKAFLRGEIPITPQ